MQQSEKREQNNNLVSRNSADSTDNIFGRFFITSPAKKIKAFVQKTKRHLHKRHRFKKYSEKARFCQWGKVKFYQIEM